jgi:hypothetical protein
MVDKAYNSTPVLGISECITSPLILSTAERQLQEWSRVTSTATEINFGSGEFQIVDLEHDVCIIIVKTTYSKAS